MSLMRSPTALALTLLASTASAHAQPAYVMNFDWDEFPTLSTRGGPVIISAVVADIMAVFERGECDLLRSSFESFAFEAKYALLLSPAGKVQEIRVLPLGCEPVENIIGDYARARFSPGTIQPPGGDTPAWYRGRLSFGQP